MNDQISEVRHHQEKKIDCTVPSCWEGRNRRSLLKEKPLCLVRIVRLGWQSDDEVLVWRLKLAEAWQVHPSTLWLFWGACLFISNQEPFQPN